MASPVDIDVLAPAEPLSASEPAVRPSGPTARRRVLRVAHLLGGREGGGITTAIASLLQGFPADVVSPSVVILRGRPTAADSRLTPFDPHYLGKTRGKLGTVLRLARWCREHQIDILHTHSVSSNFYGRLAGLLSRRTQVVTTVHANTADELRGTFGIAWLETLLSRSDLFMHRGSVQLLSVSHWLRDELISRGVPAAKIKAISHGIRLDDVDADEERVARLRQRLGIPAGQRIVGIVGRLTAVKNHALFLQMARDLHRERADVAFVIVGDGPLRGQLEKQAGDLGLRNVVHFTGWVDDPLTYLHLLDVLVSSSDSEGFGYVVLEGMACSRAVVATAVSEIPRIIEDGRTGLLTPAGDADLLRHAVGRLLDDDELRTSLGTAARARVAAHHSLQREVEEHLQVYREIEEGRAGRSS